MRIPPDAWLWPAEGIVEVGTTGRHRLRMCYDGPHTVDGRPIDYDAWPLYEAPWVHADVGTGRIRMEREGKRQELSFHIEGNRPLLPMRVIG